MYIQLSDAQEMVLRYLRHLLPLLSPTFMPPPSGKVISKVITNFDLFLPFRQHAPSLANARRKIYADINRFPGEDGAGFFNVLAFRGVFFGSPFAISNRYRWFSSIDEWNDFRMEEKEEAKKRGDEEKYYVKRNCYGQTQKERSTELLLKYWDQRLLWSQKFNKSTPPSITEVYRWLTSNEIIDDVATTLFRHIGSLTALLICGDLIEASILLMPTAQEWGGLIDSLAIGAKSAMSLLGLISQNVSRLNVSDAFASLDSVL